MSLADRAQSFISGIPVELRPQDIERELASLWSVAEAGESAQAVHTRICQANLVWIGDSDTARRVLSVLPTVIARQPCRVVLLEVTPLLAADAVEAYVNAQCFVPAPGNPEVCCEIIHFRLAAGAVSRVAGLVAPLLLPDLQTTLWSFSPSPLWEDGVRRLEHLVDRIVREVSTEPDPAAALAEMAAREKPVTTLAWYRYRSIREQVAALFDDAEALRLLPTVEAIVWHRNHDEEFERRAVGFALVAGWIASKLGWTAAPEQVSGEYRFRSAERTVAIRERAPDAARASEEIEFHCAGGARLAVSVALDAQSVTRRMTGAAVCPSDARVRSVGLSDADALGAALTGRLRERLFPDAARLGAPVLRWLLARAR